MIYTTLDLLYSDADKIKTEIMFTVATERASGTELIRFNLPPYEDEQTEKRLNSSILRILRAMKERGAIQFFANPENFENSGMESRFLLNKYPEVFENTNLGVRFIFVKI